MDFSEPGSIVIVDDNPNNLRVLSCMLQQAGYKVRPALNAEIALRAIAAYPPDLILLDVRMPGMDGYETCRRLKADPASRSIPIIFISALNETEDMLKAYKAGGVDYISKPFQSEEVMARVQAHLQLCRMQQQLEQAYTDLKASQSRLLQQDKMASIGHLAAGVAHEINTPLGFITSNLNTLRRYSDALQEYVREVEASLADCGSEVRARIDDARDRLDLPFILTDLDPMITESLEGAERVHAIVQNLMLFAHVDEAGVQEVNLNDLLDSTVNILWNEMKSRVTVVREYDADLPWVECWPQKMNQVFLNLMLNAVQAIETTGEIRLGTRRDGEAAVITVADSGRGIPPEVVGHIFDPFFTTRPVGQGTGLGLFTCYDIIDKHGGTIVVDSTPGHGSVFTIRLPIRIHPGADAPTNPEPPVRDQGAEYRVPVS